MRLKLLMKMNIIRLILLGKLFFFVSRGISWMGLGGFDVCLVGLCRYLSSFFVGLGGFSLYPFFLQYIGLYYTFFGSFSFFVCYI